MATGLGALVSGFQGGYQFSRDAARDKLIDKALDFEVAGMSRRNKNDLDFAKMMGQDVEGYDFQPETWGQKMGKTIKGWFSKPAQAISPQDAPSPELASQAPLTQPRSTQPGMPGLGGMEPEYKHGGAIVRYAHGGSTRHMKKYASGGRAIALRAGVKGFAHGGRTEYTDEERLKRSYGKYYLTEEEAAERVVPPTAGMSGATQPRGRPGVQGIPTSGGGFREAVRDVGHSASRYFDDTIKGALGGDKLIEDADAKLASAEGAREVGRATRGTGAAALTAAGETTVGFLKDTLVDNPISQGVMGFFGRDGDEKAAAVRALPRNDTPDEAAGSVAAQPAPAQPTGAGGGAAQTTPGAAAPATGANQTGVEDDPIIDMSQVREIRPEDMPNKGQKEWDDERKFYAYRAHINGQDPLEAMKAVDAKQLRGFTMYGQQAFQLLRAGNAPAAVNALYAAYQYFPNGTDVRFGVMKGKDGEPVIIGMGTDEATGKPNGKPTVITAESLSVQIENMSDPAAFKTWTKDWREIEQDIRKYYEVDKPEAQSESIYRDRLGRAALDRSAADWLTAQNASRPGGNLKQTDLDRAFAEFSKDRELQALLGGVDATEARHLVDLMSRLYVVRPGNYNSVKTIIMDSYEAGGIQQVEQDLAELGIL